MEILYTRQTEASEGSSPSYLHILMQSAFNRFNGIGKEGLSSPSCKWFSPPCATKYLLNLSPSLKPEWNIFYGFRLAVDTSGSFIYDFYLNVDKDHVSLLYLLDLSAAFDMADHANVLKCFGGRSKYLGICFGLVSNLSLGIERLLFKTSFY